MLKKHVANDIRLELDEISKKKYESPHHFKMEIRAIGVSVHLFQKTLVEYYGVMTGNPQAYDNLKKKIELEHEQRKREIEAIFNEHSTLINKRSRAGKKKYKR